MKALAPPIRKTRIVHVKCATDDERDAIQRALFRADVRAFCAVVGLLEPLPSDEARARALRFVSESMAEADTTWRRAGRGVG